MIAAPGTRSKKWTSAAAVAASAVLILIGILAIAGCGTDAVSPDNRPPKLVSLAAAPEAATVGDISKITARATDPDGDPLTYEWAAEPGFLTGAGGNVSLTLASCCFGGNTVRVTVKDGNGGEVQGVIVVGVTP
jgi:hypothetical protein